MSFYALTYCLLRDSFFRSTFFSDNGFDLGERISSAMAWLCRAQDANSDGGVALRYSLIRGWSSSYPETTGYIIPTFFRYHRMTGNCDYHDRAVAMTDFLLNIQQPDGSFQGGELGDDYNSFVFDTGQIVFGFLAAFQETGEEKYLAAAQKAGVWLVSVQGKDGAWRKYAFNTISHTYYTRVAWAIAKLGSLTGDNSLTLAACKNIDWALEKQHPNGWFDNAGFLESEHAAPFTHTIAYVIRGILETGMCLDREDYIAAAGKAAGALECAINRDRFCAGMYDKDWQAAGRYSCLTGNAQIAIVLFKLYKLTGGEGKVQTGRQLNGFLCQSQNISPAAPPGIRGGIAGSSPVWGEYQRFSYVNWAAKFFVDSLMQEKDIVPEQP